MRYINREGDGYRETVDEFDTQKEARAMLREYRILDPTAAFHISQRPCEDWRKERSKDLRLIVEGARCDWRPRQAA